MFVVRSKGQDDKPRGIDMMSRIDKLRFSVAYTDRKDRSRDNQ